MTRDVKYTVRELAEAVGGEIIGDPERAVTGIATLESAGDGDVSFCVAPKYLPLLAQTKAGAVIVPKTLRIPDTSPDRIAVAKIDEAFNTISEMFIPDYSRHMSGIHPSAVVDSTADLAPDVALGPGVTVSSQARIGAGTRILGGSYLGHEVSVGADCLIHPNVTLLDRVVVGDRVVIHSGTVVGSDGFGFTREAPGHPKQRQLGIVEIGDDVEIGACCTIDRARLEKTSIGRGTKLDNLVHVAHNVRIGENCFIVAQVGIAGSTVIGNNVILAGQAGVDSHLTIGDDIIIAGRSGVTKNLSEPGKYAGYPARRKGDEDRRRALTWRLPKMIDRLRELEKRVSELESEAENDRPSGDA
ncbi:MAG: UDP-3-O-(3-hydroxymyristoyl)glucosamine N-acyltransferase [Planctomycetota bacterium]|nr:MAG: UDP-3-O-(3-hydroxymyristoyl)glucosamine N-acyltransferase [Planctomycetota bacterium]